MLGIRHNSCRRLTFRRRTAKPINVRYWHLADILNSAANVRFRGKADIEIVLILVCGWRCNDPGTRADYACAIRAPA